jgi:hypothetical protein
VAEAKSYSLHNWVGFADFGQGGEGSSVVQNETTIVTQGLQLDPVQKTDDLRTKFQSIWRNRRKPLLEAHYCVVRATPGVGFVALSGTLDARSICSTSLSGFVAWSST